MSDVTVLVQGPFNVHSLANLKTYAKFGPVVVAGWSNVPEDLTRSAVEACRGVGATLVTLPPLNSWSLLNPQNAYFQACTTLAGLQRVDTRFVIKFRSDESYEDLSEVVKRLHRDPHRIWASSVFFRKDEQHKFHCGDHIIAGERSTMTRGFKYVKICCETMPPIPGPWQPLPEQLITRGLLLAKGVQPDFENSREQMIRHFGPLSLRLFGALACKLHMPKQHGRIVRDYIDHDDRRVIDGSGRCVHESIEEI